jgi:RNA polymerase sigma-70 factor, ECF subfamily
MAGVVSSTSPALESIDGAPKAAVGAARVRAIVTAHYDFVWRSLRRLGVAEAAADDEAQQVFCVFARRATEVPAGKEKTFLFGVVIRVAQASRRTSARRAEVMDDEGLARLATNAPGPEQLLEEARARAVLDRLLAAMPMDLRTVFILYELEEMTMADIAMTLSLRPGTVASRLRRARDVFKTLAHHAAAEAGEGGGR